MGNEILKVQDLQKSFGGLRAIDSLSFVVTEGQIKSIIGPERGREDNPLQPDYRNLPADPWNFPVHGKDFERSQTP